jgi:GxxExxY protein
MKSPQPKMVCSNCKQEGHRKPTCPNPTLPINEPAEELTIKIDLPEDVKEKLSKLASMCKEVACGLGKGHVEGVYQQALCSELQEAGVQYVSEEVMPILYKGRPIGGGHSQRLDVSLTSYLPFTYELKAVSGIKSEHHWQLVRYLEYKKQAYGAVVNFNQSDRGALEIQFIVRQNGVFYLYDLAADVGRELCDFSLSSLGDGWGC